VSLLRSKNSRRIRASLSLAGVVLAFGLLAPQAAHALIPIDDDGGGGGGGGGGGEVEPRPVTTRPPTTRSPITLPPVTQPPVAWDPTPPPPAVPKYKVEAVSFKANDESGWDRAGSDEPLWVFNGAGGDGVVKTTNREFGDVDTGETHSFNSMCVISDCYSGVSGPLSLQVTLIETDYLGSNGASYGQTAAGIITALCPFTGSYKPVCMASAPVVSQIGAWLGDDLIQTTTIHWPLTDLAPMYPGQSAQESITLSDGDARYTFTFRTTRLS
jgi:hypothetical protein